MTYWDGTQKQEEEGRGGKSGEGKEKRVDVRKRIGEERGEVKE